MVVLLTFSGVVCSYKLPLRFYFVLSAINQGIRKFPCIPITKILDDSTRPLFNGLRRHFCCNAEMEMDQA